MKTQDLRHFVQIVVRATVVVALLCALVVMSGCDALGLLLSSGPFEDRMPPAYNLKDQQERKVLVWIECPRSSGVDYDVPGKLAAAFRLYMTEKAGFENENIIIAPLTDTKNFMQDPVKIARLQGAGYVLLIHVDRYGADFLHIRDYYSGECVTRAVLLDADLGIAVWPHQPEGKMIHIAVEMEDGGRDALVSRLVSATAHCILRNLYPCNKLGYKHGDERVSIQEASEIETY